MPRPDTIEAERKRLWGRWFDAELEARHGGSNAQLVRILEGLGATYTSSTISQWKAGTTGPSETGAMYIARAWGLPMSDVLRLAGHYEAATLIDTSRETDTAIQSIRASALPAPEKQELIDYYRARIADLQETIALRIERARARTHEPQSGDAQSWLEWVTEAVASTGAAVGEHLRIEDFEKLSEGDIGRQELVDWIDGKRPPTAIGARLAALLLADLRRKHGVPTTPDQVHAEQVAALRAAGHGETAEIVEQLYTSGSGHFHGDPPRDADDKAS